VVFRGLAFAKYTVEKNPETLGFGNKNWSQLLLVMRTSGLGEFILGTPQAPNMGPQPHTGRVSCTHALGIDV